MTEPQTLEEAWAGMRFHGEMSFRNACPQCVAAADRVRALLLLGLEEATELWLEGHFNDSDRLRRRIEGLGK